MMLQKNTAKETKIFEQIPFFRRNRISLATKNNQKKPFQNDVLKRLFFCLFFVQKRVELKDGSLRIALQPNGQINLKVLNVTN